MCREAPLSPQAVYFGEEKAPASDTVVTRQPQDRSPNQNGAGTRPVLPGLRADLCQITTELNHVDSEVCIIHDQNNRVY